MAGTQALTSSDRQRTSGPSVFGKTRAEAKMTVALDTRVMKADSAAIDAAARGLEAGRLVAFPTETVYGLGADATNAAAIARLYAAKGRPAFNPLIAHVAHAA